MLFDPPALGSGTVLSRLDERALAAGFGLLALSIAALQTLNAASIALVCAAVFLPLSGLKIGRVFRRLIAVNGFLMVMALFLLFGTPGQTVAAGITHEGLIKAATMLLKGNALIILMMALLQPVGPVRLARATGLGDRFAWLLLIAWRSLFTLEARMRQLLNAARLRGFRPANSLHTYRTVANLTGELFLSSLRQSERVHEALILRGYNGRFVSIHPKRGTIGGFLLIAAVLGMCALILSVEWL